MASRSSQGVLKPPSIRLSCRGGVASVYESSPNPSRTVAPLRRDQVLRRAGETPSPIRLGQALEAGHAGPLPSLSCSLGSPGERRAESPHPPLPGLDRTDLHLSCNPIRTSREFPGGPVVRTCCLHCHRPGFNPWLGD